MCNPICEYKDAKTLKEQIEYLKTNKRVVFNNMDEDASMKILLQYNYINIISPFKYHFMKLEKNSL